jgi:hypothetical protein
MTPLDFPYTTLAVAAAAAIIIGNILISNELALLLLHEYSSSVSGTHHQWGCDFYSL